MSWQGRRWQDGASLDPWGESYDHEIGYFVKVITELWEFSVLGEYCAGHVERHASGV